MLRWIGAAILALTLMCGGVAAINPVSATPLQAMEQKPETSRATDLSTRRRAGHHTRYAHRRYYRPHYYDRPSDYAPAPFVPFNFGYGFGPWGWSSIVARPAARASSAGARAVAATRPSEVVTRAFMARSHRRL